MKKTKIHHIYSARPIHCYAYPNAAEPGYFAGRFLDALTALATCTGAITVLFFLATM